MNTQDTNYSPVVSIIGRPNVGKSTIFNRIMRKSTKALTHDEPGVTRDRHYGVAKLKDHHKLDDTDVILVDTGGFYPEKIEENEKNADKFFNIMADHAKLAIDESDLVLFVVDVREGLLPFDETISNYLRSTKKPFWLLINKYDSESQAGAEADFYSLGMEPDDMFIISSAHGRGFDGLSNRLHHFVDKLDKAKSGNLGIQYGVKPRSEVVGSLAIIGAPNAGKSTLLNQLVGTQRALVSDIAGTTVDPIEGYIEIDFRHKAKWLKAQKNDFLVSDQEMIDQYEAFQDTMEETTIAYHGEIDSNLADFSELETAESLALNEKLEQQIFGDHAEEIEEEKPVELEEDSTVRSLKMVDTAGIRRQKSVKGFIETQSVYRSLRCISDSDIVILVMDATKGISHQDRRLCDIALEKGKSLVLCLNKIDLLKEKIRDTKARREWIQDLRDTIPWLSYCELITISAKYRKNIKGLKNSIINTMVVRSRPLPTSSLNKCVYQLVDKNPIIVKGSRGKPLKVKYASMVKANPPTFLMYSNKSKDIPVNFRRYIQNGLRREFDLRNTPVHLIFRTNKDLELREKSRR